MRFAIFGDVHGNQEALEAVLEDACRENCEAHACTGDLVGYCSNPRECVELIRSLSIPVVAGDWELEISGDEEFDRLNPVARHMARWTRHALDPESLSYLRELSLVHSMDHDDWGLVHASLDSPRQFAYMIRKTDTVERTVEFRRVEFDLELTNLKLRQSGIIPPDFGG